MNWALPADAQPQCTVTHYDEFSGMAQWIVTQIVQDRQGMMWFATYNGLNRYDGYEFQRFKSRPGDGIDIPSDRIRDMILADDGNLLCKIDERVFLFDVMKCRFQTIPADMEKRALRMFERRITKNSPNDEPYIHQDLYGVTWAIHRDGTISYLQDGGWIPYPADIGRHRYLMCGTTDRQGNLWLRSDAAVYKLTFSQQRYSMLPQDRAMHVRALCLDNHQRYWVTSRDDASVRLFDKDNHLLGYLAPDGSLHQSYVSFGSPVYHVMQDSKGNFWLGSKPGGLFRLKEKALNSFRVEQFRHAPSDNSSLSSNDVYGAVEDGLGRLWIAAFGGGINCLADPDAACPTFFHQNSGLSYPKDWVGRIRQICVTKKGILLAATTSGLLIGDVSKSDLRQVSFRLHQREANRQASLASNAVLYVLEDSRHRLFVCTESGGVDQIMTDDLLAEQLDFRHYNTSTGGLPTDIALCAYETDEGLVILGNGQLILLNPEENSYVIFDAPFWKKKFHFSESFPIRMPDGRRIFGLQDGALIISDSDLYKSDFTPPLALTSISLHNGGYHRLAVNSIDTLVLATPDERDVSITFSALDYAGGGVINYAYQLGRDGVWQNIGKEHSATFLNMLPGTYQLKIRSTNSDGVWADNMRVLTIIVKPTFWETPWAKLLWLSMVVLAVWAIFYTRWYIVRLKRRQQETHEAYLALLNRGEVKSWGHVHDSVQNQATSPYNSEPEVPRLKPEDEAFMQRAMEFIENHLADSDINIGDMAEATATSRSGLNRKMKLLLGVTPLDFIREARIRKACAMLKEGEMVKDVAYACGFSDAVYFRKCFKAETGLAPSEYRDENCVR